MTLRVYLPRKQKYYTRKKRNAARSILFPNIAHQDKSPLAKDEKLFALKSIVSII